ncbi:MAG: hypothetical protein HDT15_01970 [Oscillibacter sp.]|nr:hypothetical protein [Oscillibacter sp.]
MSNFDSKKAIRQIQRLFGQALISSAEQLGVSRDDYADAVGSCLGSSEHTVVRYMARGVPRSICLSRFNPFLDAVQSAAWYEISQELGEMSTLMEKRWKSAEPDILNLLETGHHLATNFALIESIQQLCDLFND